MSNYNPFIFATDIPLDECFAIHLIYFRWLSGLSATHLLYSCTSPGALGAPEANTHVFLNVFVPGTSPLETKRPAHGREFGGGGRGGAAGSRSHLSRDRG